MADFQYTGRNAQGQTVSGRRQGSSSDQVAEALLRQGITPVSIKSISTQTSSLFSFLKVIQIRGKKVKSEELLMFCRQMYALTKAGVSLDISFLRLAEGNRNPDFVAALRKISRELAGGQNLGTCLQQHLDIFPPMLAHLVQVGEASGRLDASFLQAADYLALEDLTLKRLKSALRYPSFVVMAMVAAVIVVNVYVVPVFAKLFAGFHTALPWPTQFLIGMSAFIRDNGAYLVVATAGVVIWARTYLNTQAGRLRWGRLQLRLPVIGELLERIILARFARTFAVMVRAGIGMSQAITLVSGSLGNAWAEQRILLMNKSLERGDTLSRAAVSTGLFSPLVLQMIAVGEQTGGLDSVLDDVAEFYEREIDYDLKRLAERLEPIILIFMGGGVLILALAVFLPMWNMVNFARG